MDDYFSLLTEDEKTIFSTVAAFAYRLGYKAKKEKTKSIGYCFSHSKIHKQILRFSIDKGKPVIRMKFFATKNYSDFFHEAIRATLEEYDFKYTGCYGCGKCDGTQGYTYEYPDGRVYYRCGTELIEFYDIRNIPLEELFVLFKNQHEFYIEKISLGCSGS